MAARNAEATVTAAVASVLAQSMSNLELIIVDDASTDRTAEAARAVADSRTRVLRSDRRLGRGGARNLALREARGLYVAVCDADDVSLPSRFEAQARFLDERPMVGIVGAQVANVGGNSAPRQVYTYPTDPDAIRRRFQRGRNAVAHQASMIRRALLHELGGYDESCERAQDLELFLRATQRTAIRNLSEVLVHYGRPARTSLRYALDDGKWRRYAVYRAATDGNRLTFDEYRRRPAVRLADAVDVALFFTTRARHRLHGLAPVGLR